MMLCIWPAEQGCDVAVFEKHFPMSHFDHVAGCRTFSSAPCLTRGACLKLRFSGNAIFVEKKLTFTMQVVRGYVHEKSISELVWFVVWGVRCIVRDALCVVCGGWWVACEVWSVECGGFGVWMWLCELDMYS